MEVQNLKKLSKEELEALWYVLDDRMHEVKKSLQELRDRRTAVFNELFGLSKQDEKDTI